MEGDLHQLPRKLAQIKRWPRPHSPTAADIIDIAYVTIVCRNSRPGVGTQRPNFHHRVVAPTDGIPVPEAQPGTLIGGWHSQWWADEAGVHVGLIVAARHRQTGAISAGEGCPRPGSRNSHLPDSRVISGPPVKTRFKTFSCSRKGGNKDVHICNGTRNASENVAGDQRISATLVGCWIAEHKRGIGCSGQGETVGQPLILRSGRAHCRPNQGKSTGHILCLAGRILDEYRHQSIGVAFSCAACGVDGCDFGGGQRAGVEGGFVNHTAKLIPTPITTRPMCTWSITGSELVVIAGCITGLTLGVGCDSNPIQIENAVRAVIAHGCMMKNSIRYGGRAGHGISGPTPKHFRPEFAVGANIQAGNVTGDRTVGRAVLLTKNDSAGSGLKPNLESKRLIGRARGWERKEIIRQ